MSRNDSSTTLDPVVPNRRPRPAMTRRLRRAVELLVFALVMHLFVVPQIAGARHAASLLGSINPALVVLDLVLEAAALVAYGRLTQVLLPEAHRPRLAVCTAVVLASTGVNHVLPGGAATTAAVNARLLDRMAVPVADIAFVLTTQGLGSAVVLNVRLWFSLVISIPTTGFAPLYATAAAFGAVLLALVASLVVGLLHGKHRLERIVLRVVDSLPRVHPDRAVQALHHFADQLAVLAADRKRLRNALVWATANWLLDATVLWLMLAAFGHRAGVVGLMVAYCLANVLAALPITPGGLGIVEAVLIPTLVGFGTPAGVAAVGVIGYRLINFWLPIPVGAAAYAGVKRHARLEGYVGSFRDDLNELSPDNPKPSEADPTP